MRACMRTNYSLPAWLAMGLLLGGCDQSINYPGANELTLTGLYCDAQTDQAPSCKAGDLVKVAEGREHLLCDWNWQVVHEPAGNAVLCIYRGSTRDTRSAAGPE